MRVSADSLSEMNVCQEVGQYNLIKTVNVACRLQAYWLRDVILNPGFNCSVARRRNAES